MTNLHQPTRDDDLAVRENSIQIPAPIRPGAHIRIVSPTGPSIAHLEERRRRGESALTELGFTVSYGRNALVLSEDGIAGPTARARAVDLMEAFADPSVDAVLAADAGLGSRDLLEFLDSETIATSRKPFIGFCDNVFISQYLLSRARLSSLYGCTLLFHLGEAGGCYKETTEYLVASLDSANALECQPVVSRTGEIVNWYDPDKDSRPRRRSVPGGWTWLRQGRSSGRLIGAEIRAIQDLIKMFDISLDSTVLFWHNTRRGLDPETYLADLCAVADLTKLAGMIVGAHPFIPPAQWAARVSDMLDELLPDIDYPVLVNADIGNLCPAWVVPFGEDVVIDSESRSISFRKADGKTNRAMGT